VNEKHRDVYLVSGFSVKLWKLVIVTLFALLTKLLRDHDFALLFGLAVPVKQKHHHPVK
jgi:hypothetical protein